MFTQSTLADCGFPTKTEQVWTVSPSPFGPVTQLLREFQVAEEKHATLEMENQNLRAELCTFNAEVGHLKDQLVQKQLANNARVDMVLDNLASALSFPFKSNQSST